MKFSKWSNVHSVIVGALLAVAAGLLIGAYVPPDPGGRDGFQIDTSNGDLLLMRAGTKVAKISAAGALTATTSVTATTGVAGTTGTFSGAVSGTTGTFTGAVAGLNTLLTKTTDYVVDASTDCGSIIRVATDGVYLTLPTVSAANAGCCVTLVNGGAATAVGTGFSVNANDAVFGTVANSAGDVSASGIDDQAWGSTKATSQRSDYCTVCSNGGDGWDIVGCVGIWASAAQ